MTPTSSLSVSGSWLRLRWLFQRRLTSVADSARSLGLTFLGSGLTSGCGCQQDL